MEYNYLKITKIKRKSKQKKATFSQLPAKVPEGFFSLKIRHPGYPAIPMKSDKALSIHRVVQKRDTPASFCNNFPKCTSIVTIFSPLQQEMYTLKCYRFTNVAPLFAVLYVMLGRAVTK